MSDLITSFLANTHCADWVRNRLTGDASTRRYERLESLSGETAVLMICKPGSAAEMDRFIVIANALRAAGLAAPQIYNSDTSAGLMLIEDLGTDDIASVMRRTPELDLQCYTAATDVLLNLRKVSPLDLSALNAKNAAAWLDPLADWYGPQVIDIAAIQTSVLNAFDTLGLKADTLSLRDYHAENLIWRHQEQGLASIGLLDFQDAVYAPAGYDFASLTRDARRDVDPELTDALTVKMARDLNVNQQDFEARVACLSVQRNLRILGIFASLAKRDGKTDYAAYAPRVWRYLQRDLAHPALTDLQKAVLTAVPEPTQDFLARWTK